MVKHTEPDQTLIQMPSLRAVRTFVAAAKYQNYSGVRICGHANRFEEGWLAWELGDVRPIESFLPIRAARGIYEVDFP